MDPSKSLSLNLIIQQSHWVMRRGIGDAHAGAGKGFTFNIHG